MPVEVHDRVERVAQAAQVGCRRVEAERCEAASTAAGGVELQLLDRARRLAGLEGGRVGAGGDGDGARHVSIRRLCERANELRAHDAREVVEHRRRLAAKVTFWPVRPMAALSSFSMVFCPGNRPSHRLRPSIFSDDARG